ncbi:hypothetical protein ACMHYB_49885 [Sorangium sp. So ce1128]
MTVDPAEVIVLVMMPNVSADGLVTEEALLQAGAEAALGQDGRFRADGGLVVFRAELAPELQGELDHRRDREQRLAKHGAPVTALR